MRLKKSVKRRPMNWTPRHEMPIALRYRKAHDESVATSQSKIDVVQLIMYTVKLDGHPRRRAARSG